MNSDSENDLNAQPGSSATNKLIRGALQAVGGAVPFAGGIFSAVTSAWSEHDQEKVNNFLHAWIKMLGDELKEKEKTIIEILARLNMQDKEIIKRVESKEYQSLLNKTFREWAGAESETKRKLIRNILTSAASTHTSSDEVIKLFITWIGQYSELHFQVIGAIYNSQGISRGTIWEKLKKSSAREDSAEADIYKLLIRDLSTGGIIRQHRQTDYRGNFLKTYPKKSKADGRTHFTSAFDKEELYELTALGQQFVHYAMAELTAKIEHKGPIFTDSTEEIV